MWRFVVAVMAAGCGRIGFGESLDGGPGGGDGGPGDGAMIDSVISSDAPPAVACFGTVEQICLPFQPGTSIMFAITSNVDTDADPLCAELAQGTTVNSCVIAGTTIAVSSMVNAHGSRPLVLLATTSFIQSPSSVIDATKNHLGPAVCGAGVQPVGVGGGFGGSFGAPGGNGGNGDSPAVGGIASGPIALNALRRGCHGGTGGNGGDGGRGGGALEIISPVITISGTINASGSGGAGGSGGASIGGGGGGGSGGTIILDSPDVTISASGRLFAQGGSGGEGGGVLAPGVNGTSPNVAGMPAGGGAGGTAAGGDGGLGSVGGNGSNGDNGSSAGGGGAGGGTGHILCVDPAPTLSGATFPTLQ